MVFQLLRVQGQFKTSYWEKWKSFISSRISLTFTNYPLDLNFPLSNKCKKSIFGIILAKFVPPHVVLMSNYFSCFSPHWCNSSCVKRVSEKNKNNVQFELIFKFYSRLKTNVSHSTWPKMTWVLHSVYCA